MSEFCLWCGEPVEKGADFHDKCYDEYLGEEDRRSQPRAAPLVNKAHWEATL